MAGTQNLCLCYQGGTGQAFPLCPILLVKLGSPLPNYFQKAGDLDELKSTAGYWFTHGGGAKAARGV